MCCLLRRDLSGRLMPGSKDFNSIKKYIFCLIYVAAVALSVFYGAQKQGFHEDEYYTYYSTNRSVGLFQPDREWQDAQTILDEFAVKKGEGFNYGLVKLVQSWDVHPPFYYFIFHTICSIVPGVFTKWTGIITNLMAFTVAFVFFVLLMRRLKVAAWVEILTLMFWALNPQTVSANIFVRMYAWLGAAIFACAYFHVRLIQDYDDLALDLKGLFIRGLLPIMAVSYVGFLIQYFYIFFFFCIGVATAAIIVFLRKDIRGGILYVGSCALSLALAVLTYPSCLSHLFGGYRGSDASGSFFDLGNTWMRLSFFTGLLNDFVFGGGLVIIAALLFIGTLLKIGTPGTVLPVPKREKSGTSGTVLPVPKREKIGTLRTVPGVPLVIAGAVGYFLLASKTALLVGAASNRYEMPVYGLLILLVFMDAGYVLESVGSSRMLIYAFAAVCMALLLKGHVADQRVLFLYPEDKEKIAYAADNSDEVAVVMFNPATPQNVWRLTDELLEYKKVYYMDEENLEPITDPEVTGADRIILYAADDDFQEEAFSNLLGSCSKPGTMAQLFKEDMWTSYEVK